MSSFLSRINNFKDSLTPNEVLVVEFLCSHPMEAIDGSIQQVARRTGVSVASVSRLASTLGYKDWKELRLRLAADFSPNGNPVLADIDSKDPDEIVVQKVFNSNIVSLKETYEQIAMADIARVVETIVKTDRIVFFGSGGSGCIARDESLRFAHLEMSAEAYSEEFQMMLQAARMKKGQVAFGFSNSGRSKAVINAMAEARRNQAMAIGIANFRNTPLEEECDLLFCTSFPQRSGTTAALTARIATQSIMDAIYVLSAQHGRIAHKVRHMDKILENTLRVQRQSNKTHHTRKPD